MSGYALPATQAGARANDLPAIAGTRSGPALVCGAGRSLWSDLAAVSGLRADVVAVNFVGFCLRDPPAHWASIDSDMFQFMLGLRIDESRRWENGRLKCAAGIETHGMHAAPGVRHLWPLPRDGSSGLFSVRVALGMGYAPVIVCGCPLDNSGHFYEQPDAVPIEATDYTGYREAWEKAARVEFRDRVRAVSGWLRDLMGAH